MVKHFTTDDKEQAQTALPNYIKAPESRLTIEQYMRLNMWLEGSTYKQIAADSGVTVQAVAHSVRRDLKKVLAFANDKD